uniref:Uncharacterized protein n=1 Tax=Anguilla anguilla TaxID=7936 RepID=A0A0E9QWX7_ANGAN
MISSVPCSDRNVNSALCQLSFLFKSDSIISVDVSSSTLRG